MIVAEIVLAAGLLLSVAERWLAERSWAHERRVLIQGIVARHAPDLAALVAAETAPKVHKVEPRKATAERPGINLDGQLVDDRGQVVDETAMVGLPGNV